MHTHNQMLSSHLSRIFNLTFVIITAKVSAYSSRCSSRAHSLESGLARKHCSFTIETNHSWGKTKLAMVMLSYILMAEKSFKNQKVYSPLVIPRSPPFSQGSQNNKIIIDK